MNVFDVVVCLDRQDSVGIDLPLIDASDDRASIDPTLIEQESIGATSIKCTGRTESLRTTGLPLIGKVPGVEGAYVATAHSVWGILNAPGTGEAVAELIADGGTSSVDISAYDPKRLRPVAAAR